MTRDRSSSRTPIVSVRFETLASSVMTVQTPGEGFVDVTGETRAFLDDAGAGEGIVTLFCRHTSASLTIQENADPSVLVDLQTALRRIAPEDGGWVHDSEGPDDMPGHIKTMVTATSLAIPVSRGRPMLGTWQAIYLVEHRRRAHRREIVMQFAGCNR